jgi:hypothetical protein
MQAKQLVDRIGDFADPVFGHEPGETAGQMMILEHSFHQVTVKHGPGTFVRRGFGLQQFSQSRGYCMSPRTALSGDRNGAAAHSIPISGPLVRRLQLGANEAETMVESKG